LLRPAHRPESITALQVLRKCCTPVSLYFACTAQARRRSIQIVCCVQRKKEERKKEGAKSTYTFSLVQDPSSENKSGHFLYDVIIRGKWLKAN